MPIYLWRKFVSRAWLDEHQAELDACNAAVIEWPGRKRILIEVASHKLTVTRLTKAFGGGREKLASNYIGKFLQTQRSRPIRVGRRLLITNVKIKTKVAQLVIPAGAAFGTGEHATTAMSLRMLERVTRRLTPKAFASGASGWRMLDAGTGSGILALAGSRFGAAEVQAIDNDPLAISTAQANAKRNHIRFVHFICGDVTERFADSSTSSPRIFIPNCLRRFCRDFARHWPSTVDLSSRV